MKPTGRVRGRANIGWKIVQLGRIASPSSGKAPASAEARASHVPWAGGDKTPSAGRTLTSPASALRSSNSWSAPRVSRLGQSQPRQTASLCCIGDQPRQFRTLLRDFRRPCPCCTHRLHPPIKPPLGPTHQFRCSKKLLARHHFHDPPPDGPIRRIELRPPISALSWLARDRRRRWMEKSQKKSRAGAFVRGDGP
jgi:hypothetical protein